MKFFRSTSPKVRNRVRLGVQTLEAREVPATLVPLDTVGATATVNGAILQQAGAVATNSGQFDTFLRLDDTGTEHGYNTDARPFQFDQLGDLTVTHSLLLADIPTVTIGNTVYREFYLHVRERQAAPRVTLDELRIFVSEVGNLANYSNANKTLAGNAAVFNLDGAGNVSVRLNDSLNGTTGKGDAFVLVPDSVFGGADLRLPVLQVRCPQRCERRGRGMGREASGAATADGRFDLRVCVFCRRRRPGPRG